MSHSLFKVFYNFIQLSTIAPQHSNAPTTKLGSPVKHAAPPHATTPAHSNGYLITGGVQSMTTPLTPAINALVGDVALYTLTHVFVNPYAEPTTGTNGATDFRAVFTIINISFSYYLNNRKIIPRNNHVAPLNKPGLIPFVTGFIASPMPKADINKINNRLSIIIILFFYFLIFILIFLSRSLD